MTDKHRLDARGLRALAHPLRVRMLGTLRSDGPATATQLAQRLGESTGTTSWHLRQLAEHGFIEEDPDRGTKRDRWWKAVHSAMQLSVSDFSDRPELAGSLSVYLQSVLEQHYRRAADFVAGGAWAREWQEAATMSNFSLRLDPARLEALNAELFAVIERYTAEPSPDGSDVAVQIQAFPR